MTIGLGESTMGGSKDNTSSNNGTSTRIGKGASVHIFKWILNMETFAIDTNNLRLKPTRATNGYDPRPL